jgi:hypothetical protein
VGARVGQERAAKAVGFFIKPYTYFALLRPQQQNATMKDFLRFSLPRYVEYRISHGMEIDYER